MTFIFFILLRLKDFTLPDRDVPLLFLTQKNNERATRMRNELLHEGTRKNVHPVVAKACCLIHRFRFLLPGARYRRASATGDNVAVI